MLLVSDLTNTKIYKKPEKMTEIGTHLTVLSESYPMNTNMTGFRWFSKILVLWTKVAISLEWSRHW